VVVHGAVEEVLEVVGLDVAVVLDVPVLAVVAEVFCVGEGGAAGVCGDSVRAKRIAAEIKLQTRMIIERFIDHPFEDIVAAKVSRARR
jgi:hypothetical protein